LNFQMMIVQIENKLVYQNCQQLEEFLLEPIVLFLKEFWNLFYVTM
jgi:hypothetical protein